MGIDNLRFENAKNRLESDFASAWAEIEEMSDSGDEEAMIFVADCYYKGNYAEMDESLAYQLFNKIVSMYPDNGLIWEKIADCHFYGYGVPESHQAAISKYEEAWKHGYVDAASDIGWIYAFGDISPNDKQTAVKWFQRAADKGSVDGKYYMGLFYDRGYEVLPVNKKLAHKYFSEAAADGNLPALIYLLREHCYGDEEEFHLVLSRMIRLAEDGNSKAQYDLAMSYLLGMGVGQDAAAAQKYLEQAADAGNRDARFELGRQLIDLDSDFAHDFDKGHKLLLEAAENGNAEAMEELYHYYSYCEVDKERSIYWAEQAVNHGINSAALRREIADWFYDEGNMRDCEKAIQYYEALFNDQENTNIFRTYAILPLAVCYLKSGKSTCDYYKIRSLLEKAKQCAESGDAFYKGKSGEILYWMEKCEGK